MEEEKKSFKEWLNEKSERAKWKLHCFAEWCGNNKEIVVVYVPVIAGSIVKLGSIAMKTVSIREQKALKDRYIYDPKRGHYYELRRKPRNSEWVEIDVRKESGEPLGIILNDMGLLK